MYPQRRHGRQHPPAGELAPLLTRVEHPRSLAEMVETRLRDAIVNAELPFGRALPEDETGAALGVSRTPLRAALARLETQGLVTIVPNRGAFVFNPSLGDVRQLAAFRLLLERSAIEECLASRPAPLPGELRAALARMTAAQREEDGRGYAQADTEFHEIFFRHCGNAYLAHAFRTIAWQVAALRAHLSVDRAWERDTSLAEHAAIVEAVEARDRRRLRAILADHVLRAGKAYAALLGEEARPG